jgi:hypothetical protein
MLILTLKQTVVAYLSEVLYASCIDLYSDNQFIDRQFFCLGLIIKGEEQTIPFVTELKLYEFCSLSSCLFMHTSMYSSKIDRSAIKI